MLNIKSLNKEDITPETLRTFKGFEHITEEEAEAVCELTIHLCSAAYELARKTRRPFHESIAKRI